MSSEEAARRIDAAKFMGDRDESIARAQKASTGKVYKRLMPVSSKMASAKFFDDVHQPSNPDVTKDNKPALPPIVSSDPPPAPPEPPSTPSPESETATHKPSGESCAATILIVVVVVGLIIAVTSYFANKDVKRAIEPVPVDFPQTSRPMPDDNLIKELFKGGA